MKFIHVIDQDGDPVDINLDHVILIRPFAGEADGAKIFFKNAIIYTATPYPEVMKRIHEEPRLRML